MRAMVLRRQREALVLEDLPTPVPGPGQVRIRVAACAVCRTDLHVVDGELQHPKLPLIPGHEIIGRVSACGDGVDRFRPGDRVGVPWLGWTCGVCEYCRGGRENLCPRARFTGYQIDGGYAEYAVADERYCFAIDARFRRCRSGAADVRRADRLPHAAHGRRRAAHRHLRLRRRRAHRRAGGAARGAARCSPSRARAIPTAQQFARSLGADWAGGSDEPPPEPLDAALIFAPVGDAGAGGAARDRARRHRGLRRHPHERHSVLPL